MPNGPGPRRFDLDAEVARALRLAERGVFDDSEFDWWPLDDRPPEPPADAPPRRRAKRVNAAAPTRQAG